MRNLGLDLVRFLSVLLVLFRHCDYKNVSNPLLTVLLRGGWVGVDIFFVLSGFLISSLLFKEYRVDGNVKLTRFLVRRAFKIWPSFWAMILVAVLTFPLINYIPTNEQIAHELLFVQNYFHGVYGHTWSLAVEEHFYFGFALLVASLRKFYPKTFFNLIPKVFLCLFLLCTFWRSISVLSPAVYEYRKLFFLTHLRIDSLFFGVVLSYLVHFRNLGGYFEKIPGLWLVGVGLGLLSPAFIFPSETCRWILAWGVVLFYFASGLIVLGAQRLSISDSKLLRGCGSLGAASYSIYLWHLFVRDWVPVVIAKIIGHYPTGNTLICGYLFGSLVLGWTLNRIFEVPILKLRDSFLTEQKTAAARISITS